MRKLALLVVLVLAACGNDAAIEQANTWTCQDYWDNIEGRRAVAMELLTRGWINIDEASRNPPDELAQQFTVALVNRCGARVDAGEGGVELSDEAADIYVNSGTMFRPPGETE